MQKGPAQRNVEKILKRSARVEQRDAAQELAAATQVEPNVAQTPRRMAVGIACTLVGGVLWGVNGSVSKILMEQYGASPMWVACVREIFAGLVFLACGAIGSPKALRKAFTTVRDYPMYLVTALTCVTLVQVAYLFSMLVFLACGAIGSPKALRKAFTTVRDYPMYLVTALTCVTLVQVAYLFSIHWTNAGTATVLLTVNLLMVVGYVCVRGRRRPSAREVVGVALAFTGVWLLATGGDFGALSLPRCPDCCGASPTRSRARASRSSLSNSLRNTAISSSTASRSCSPASSSHRSCGRGRMCPRLMRADGGCSRSPWSSAHSWRSGCTWLLTPFVRPWAHVPAFDARGWWLLAFTVVVGTFVAFWLYMAGVVRIGSRRATMFGTIEPVAATVTAVLWTGAIFTPIDFVGFALILIMAFLVH